MPEQAHDRRRRTALKLGFGVAVLAILAPFPLEVRRLVMLGLFTVMWLSMIVLDRIVQAQGRSSGLRRYIIFVGLGLIVLVVILLLEG